MNYRGAGTSSKKIIITRVNFTSEKRTRVNYNDFCLRSFTIMQLNKCVILTSMDKTIIQDRNYYKSPQSFPTSPSPECNRNPGGKKTIFCLRRRATNGSSLCAVAKKVLYRGIVVHPSEANRRSNADPSEANWRSK